MIKAALFIVLALCTLTACQKSNTPAASNSSINPAPKAPDALQQKLTEHSGCGATDCGRLDVHAAETPLKNASDCAMQAAQQKHAFYVAYDMPGMSVGVAGHSDGKLWSAQSQNGAVNSGACPSQLRVASSGRVTCFAPGDMGSMGGHSTVAPGTPNPHAAGNDSNR